MKTIVTAVLAVLAALPLSQLLAAQTFEHSGQPPQLIELYTSEGCSSCPPADERISRLLKHPDLWSGVVPVTFHVDYWDYLGWGDRFAKASYSARQRQLKRDGQLRAVYTPGWVVDGREWRGFFRGRPLPEPAARDGGRLSAELSGTSVRVAYQPQSTPEGRMTAHLVVLGFDYETRVERGENRGKVLEHQFVVLEKQQAEGAGSWQFRLPQTLTNIHNGQRRAMVFWISESGRPQPLQVVGGWLER